MLIAVIALDLSKKKKKNQDVKRIRSTGIDIGKKRCDACAVLGKVTHSDHKLTIV